MGLVKRIWSAPSSLSSNYCMPMNGHLFTEGWANLRRMAEFQFSAERLRILDGIDFWTAHLPAGPGEGLLRPGADLWGHNGL